VKGPLEKGDIAILELRREGGEPERIHINYGKNFGDDVIEEALPEMTLGDTVSIMYEGEPAELEFVSIRRRRVPALDDGFIREQGIEGVDTVDDYTAFVKDRMVKSAENQKLAILSDYVVRQVSQKSSYEVADEDAEKMYQDLYGQIRMYAGDMPIEEFMPGILTDQFHKKITTMEQAEKELKVKSVSELKKQLSAEAYAEQNGKTFGEDTFMEFLEGMSKANGVPVDQLKQMVSYEQYLQNAPLIYSNDAMTAYFREKMNVTMKEGKAFPAGIKTCVSDIGNNDRTVRI